MLHLINKVKKNILHLPKAPSMYMSEMKKTVETCKIKLKSTSMHAAQDKYFLKSRRKQKTTVQWKTENKVNGCDEPTSFTELS